MSQYIILEDAITYGIQTLVKYIKDPVEKNTLDTHTDLFNTIGCDFQDTWPDDFWACYETIREGDITNNTRNSDEQVSRLQDLALTLNKESKSEKSEESKALEEVDQLSLKFKPRNNPEIHNKKCCNCLIF